MAVEVKIGELKAGLSRHLRFVRRGGEIIVKDRDRPIARIVPYRSEPEALKTRLPTKSLQEVEDLLASRTPPELKLSMEEILEDLREARKDWFDKRTRSSPSLGAGPLTTNS